MTMQTSTSQTTTPKPVVRTGWFTFLLTAVLASAVALTGCDSAGDSEGSDEIDIFRLWKGTDNIPARQYLRFTDSSIQHWALVEERESECMYFIEGTLSKLDVNEYVVNYGSSERVMTVFPGSEDTIRLKIGSSVSTVAEAEERAEWDAPPCSFN